MGVYAEEDQDGTLVVRVMVLNPDWDGHFRLPAFSRVLGTQGVSPLLATTWTTSQFDEPNAEDHSEKLSVAVEASPCHWAIAKQECAECVEGKPTKMKQKFRASLKLAETGDAMTAKLSNPRV